MEEILELLAPYIADRMGQIYKQNTEYQNALVNENELFEKLNSKLDDGQAALLDEYFSAANMTSAVREKLTYQQGMEDLLKVLSVLTRNG